jgi:hypothetical protein
LKQPVGLRIGGLISSWPPMNAADLCLAMSVIMIACTAAAGLWPSLFGDE